MTPEELRAILQRLEDKLDNLTDLYPELKWRVSSHEWIAAAAVTIVCLIAAFK